MDTQSSDNIAALAEWLGTELDGVEQIYLYRLDETPALPCVLIELEQRQVQGTSPELTRVEETWRISVCGADPEQEAAWNFQMQRLFSAGLLRVGERRLSILSSSLEREPSDKTPYLLLRLEYWEARQKPPAETEAPPLMGSLHTTFRE